MNRLRTFGPIVALAAVVVALVAWASAGGSAPAPAATGEAAVHTNLACELALGTRARFEIQQRTEVELDLSPLMGGSSGNSSSGLSATPAQRREIGHDFTLATEVVAANERGVVLAARLDPVRAVGDNRDQDLGAIDAPFLIRLDRRCRVRDFGWRADGDLRAAKSQQTLVAPLNFVLPETGRSRYMAEAFDFTGRYRALFAVQGETLRGRNLGYTSVFSGGRDGESAGAESTEVRSGTLEVRRSADVWFDELEHEREITLLAGGRRVGSLSTRTEAHRAETVSAIDEVAPPSDAGWTFGILLDREFGDDSATGAPAEELRQMDLEQALSRLVALTEGGSDPASYTTFLRDWLRAHPEALEGLLSLIREGWFRGRPTVRAAVFAALSAAATPETRAALMEIYTSEDYSFGYRLDAAHALAHTPSPPPEFLPQLIREAQAGPAGLEQASMKLTVGMFASAQDAIIPEQTATAREALADWLEDGGDEDARVHALQAAGNAAHDDLADGIAGYLDDESPRVRTFAADALRNLSAEQAMRHIASAFADEGDVGVRLALLRSAAENAGGRGEGASAEVAQLAASGLSGVPSDVEYEARVEVVGGAARHGNEDASAALAREFERERAREELNARRLQGLGRYVGNRWSPSD